MKKNYETPSVEVVKFQYSDQVVATSAKCDIVWINVETSTSDCDKPIQHKYVN